MTVEIWARLDRNQTSALTSQTTSATRGTQEMSPSRM